MSWIGYCCGFNSVFYLKEFGLKSSEGTSNPEIQFLSGVHWQCLILVRGDQLSHGSFYVLICYSTKLCSKYSLQITIKHTNDWNMSHFVLESSPQLIGGIAPYTMQKRVKLAGLGVGIYGANIFTFRSSTFYWIQKHHSQWLLKHCTHPQTLQGTCFHISSSKLLNTTHTKCHRFCQNY